MPPTPEPTPAASAGDGVASAPAIRYFTPGGSRPWGHRDKARPRRSNQRTRRLPLARFFLLVAFPLDRPAGVALVLDPPRPGPARGGERGVGVRAGRRNAISPGGGPRLGGHEKQARPRGADQ